MKIWEILLLCNDGEDKSMFSWPFEGTYKELCYEVVDVHQAYSSFARAADHQVVYSVVVMEVAS